MMFGAGVLSGLLGIGSGAVKVLAMDQAMKIPFKVSTTTSNFMIGVTAAASAGLYLSRGYIAPGVAMPVMLGVLAGSLIGAKVLVRARVQTLRYLFAVVIVVLGIEMIFNGVTGTNMSRQAIDDQRIEIIIGNLLRAGVLLAGAVVVLGGICTCVVTVHEMPNYVGFHGEPEEFRTLSGIIRRRLAWQRTRAACSWACCCSSRRRWRGWRSRFSPSPPSATGCMWLSLWWCWRFCCTACSVT